MYFLSDQINSTRLMLAAGGWPVSQDTYYPFGVEPYSPADQNHYKFSGKERDADTGNDDFGARYYGPIMGRFLSSDWSATPEAMPYADLANPQSFNRYVYANNNPLSGIDPDGHQTTGQNGKPCGGVGTVRSSMGGTSGYVVAQVPCSSAGQGLAAQQQNGSGPSPATPPAVFTTLDNAAQWGLVPAAVDAKSNGWEYGGALYQNSDGTYGATTPRTDHDPGSVGTTEYYAPIPAGTKRVGDYHVHTGINSTDHGMHFSQGDISIAQTQLKVNGRQTSYMVNPKGQVWRYNPATDRVPVLLPWKVN